MAADPCEDPITIAEAARLLKVSAVTVQRWLKQGWIPSYRLGPSYVRIRRQDVEKLIVPAYPGRLLAELPTLETAVRPLTEEVERRLRAVEDCKDLVARILARRSGKPLPSSWRLIRQARDERSERI